MWAVAYTRQRDDAVDGVESVESEHSCCRSPRIQLAPANEDGRSQFGVGELNFGEGPRRVGQRVEDDLGGHGRRVGAQ